MLAVYTLEQADEWDRIVRSFKDYDVFYLSGYSKAFMLENPENGIPVLLFYESGYDRAVNVVFRRDVSLDKHLSGKVREGQYYDIITPYGYGGFRGNVSDWEKLNREYAQHCKEQRYVCEFVRFELFSEYSGHYGGRVESRTHNVVRNLEMPLDDIWMDFKPKVRKNVKRANSCHLECVIENDGCHLDEFLRIYYATMDRTEAGKDFYFSRQFYENLNKMKDNVKYFYVLYRGKIVSAELVIYGSQNAYSYLGGTDREYFDVRPNDFLKWEIIKWGKESGLKNFVLGGGYGVDDGIFQYKLCLAPKGLYDFYIGRTIFDNDSYEMLVGLRDEDNLNKRFFPLYRS